MTTALRRVGQSRGIAHGLGSLRSAPQLQSQPSRVGPVCLPLRLSPLGGGSLRCFATRAEGTVKMWNDEKGFGFISPGAGGEDVFVHRSALQEGVQLSQGMPVSYDPEWDERKRKDRAANVATSEGGGGSGGDSAAPAGSSGGGGSFGGAAATAVQSIPQASGWNLVSAGGKWEISRQPMSQDGGSSLLRQRVTIHKDSPKGSTPDLKKEEFQLCGDGSWDKRVYPAGPDREESVVLKPSGAGAKAAGQRGKGHGRNWVVEGKVGSSWDIVFDPQTQMVTVEQAFVEGQ